MFLWLQKPTELWNCSKSTMRNWPLLKISSCAPPSNVSSAYLNPVFFRLCSVSTLRLLISSSVSPSLLLCCPLFSFFLYCTDIARSHRYIYSFSVKYAEPSCSGRGTRLNSFPCSFVTFALFSFTLFPFFQFSASEFFLVTFSKLRNVKNNRKILCQIHPWILSLSERLGLFLITFNCRDIMTAFEVIRMDGIVLIVLNWTDVRKSSSAT